MRDTGHIITKVERSRYVYFICPCAPKMEVISFDAPVRCPMCRLTNPIRFGGREEREEISFNTLEYSGDLISTLTGNEK